MEEVECPNGDPIIHKGKEYKPLSRSFLFGTLEDNPYIKNTNYTSILAATPEPLRSQLLYGDFAVEAKGDPWQVIPTKWVRLAQKRWMERERPSMPVSGVGADIARGGSDSMVVAKRYGDWFDEPSKTAGVDVEDGPAAAGLIQHQLEDEPHIGYINIDVIGVGTSCYDSAKAMWPGIAQAVNAAAKSDYIAMSKTDPPAPLFTMRNVRAEYHWRLREALDPANDSTISLPPGNEILADLCAARYKVMAGGVIQIESKDDIKKRIGRSPDVGEAIMLALADSYGIQEPEKKKAWVH
jgi:hypothetical protein